MSQHRTRAALRTESSNYAFISVQDMHKTSGVEARWTPFGHSTGHVHRSPGADCLPAPCALPYIAPAFPPTSSTCAKHSVLKTDASRPDSAPIHRGRPDIPAPSATSAHSAPAFYPSYRTKNALPVTDESGLKPAPWSNPRTPHLHRNLPTASTPSLAHTPRIHLSSKSQIAARQGSAIRSLSQWRKRSSFTVVNGRTLNLFTFSEAGPFTAVNGSRLDTFSNIIPFTAKNGPESPLTSATHCRRTLPFGSPCGPSASMFAPSHQYLHALVSRYGMPIRPCCARLNAP